MGRKPKYGSKRWIELNGLNAFNADIPINLKNSKNTAKLEFVTKNNSDLEIKNSKKEQPSNSKKEQPSKIRVMATGSEEACTSGSYENGKKRKSGDKDADYEPDDSGSNRSDDSDESDVSDVIFYLIIVYQLHYS
jgi:hypothetical protein